MSLTIHPCPFDTRPCDNWNCRSTKGKKKYFIGREGLSVPKPIFCEDCIRHMLANLPIEFIDGGVDLEQRLRREITAEYDKKLAELVEAEVQVRLAQMAKELAAQMVQQKAAEAMPETDPAAEDSENATQNTIVYRCLVCNEELRSQEELEAHLNLHENEEVIGAPEKPKSGGRKKSVAIAR